LEYIIDELDSITVMTVDPGFAGQPFIQGMVKKIAQLQDLKQRKGYTYEIEVDGGVNQRTLAMLMEAGAERFVLGSSGLFNLGSTLEESIAIARSYIPFKLG
jgi:D-allulose-6-phosphate 3-epimerase